MSVGSMLMNQSAAGSVAKARNAASEAERNRQSALDAEAAGINEGSRNRYTDFGGQQAGEADKLAQFFRSANQPMAESMPVEPSLASGNNLVVRERQKQNEKAKAFGNQQADALGNLRSFGEVLGGISRDQARDAAKVGTIGSFQRGSASVLPLELEAANSKGAGARTFADLLAGGGNLALSAGLSGSNVFGGSAPKLPSAFGAKVPTKPLPDPNLTYGIY